MSKFYYFMTLEMITKTRKTDYIMKNPCSEFMTSKINKPIKMNLIVGIITRFTMRFQVRLYIAHIQVFGTRWHFDECV